MSGELRAQFVRTGFADLTALIPAAWRERASAEAIAALDAHGARRDLRIPVTGDSPRRYRIVGRDRLASAAPSAAALYRSDALLALVGAVAGEAVVPVPYAAEELIATRLEFAGDTHGWHWDDYGYALIWVLQAPAPGGGGELEYVTGVPWCKTQPRVDAILAAREPQRTRVAAGTVYLLRTDTTLHRITPLARDGRRDALCFSYASAADAGRTASHESLDAILAG
jgi:hypothetical protein